MEYNDNNTAMLLQWMNNTTNKHLLKYYNLYLKNIN